MANCYLQKKSNEWVYFFEMCKARNAHLFFAIVPVH